jgi:hypothetical protein
MEYGKVYAGAAIILATVFIPGVALCYALFPKKDELDNIERIGLSFVLGMAPTFLLYALEKNLSVPTTTATAFTVIGLVTLLGFIGYKIRKPK